MAWPGGWYGLADCHAETLTVKEATMVTKEQLAGAARAALGTGHRLTGVARLRGGSKKGVYRLVFDGGSTAIAYIWDDDENYWPARQAGDGLDPFSEASGIELFQSAHRYLDALGIRTPRVYLADQSRSRYPADIAVVEDVPGENLETRLGQDPPGASAIMARLAEAVATMNGHIGPGFGQVALIERGGIARGQSCEQVVLDRALGHLAEAAARVDRMARVHGQLEDVVRTLAAAVRPRSRYGSSTASSDRTTCWWTGSGSRS
jgi:hypothetical protein